MARTPISTNDRVQVTLPPLIVTSFLYQNAAGTYTSVRLGISRDHFLLTRMTLKWNMLWLFKRKAKTGSCEDTELGQVYFISFVSV